MQILPYVQKIRQKYPDNSLTKGQGISFFDIEQLIGVNSSLCLFRTITNKWRRMLETESGIITCVQQKHFIILDEHRKLNLSASKFRSAVNFARRSIEVASRINTRELSQDERERLNLLSQRNASMISVSMTKSNIELPTSL